MSRIRLLATVIALASPSAARADFVVATGVRWNPIDYTMPVSTVAADATTYSAKTTPLSGWNTTNLSSYVGAFFLDGRLGFHLALDVGYSAKHDTGINNTPQDLSYTQVGFAIGGKWYITKPQGGHVSPYLYLDIYKYFALVSTSVMLPKGYESFIGGLASPLGMDLAVGAEYFFTPAFSLGAELLGLRYAYTYGEYTPSAGLNSMPINETNHYVTFYTGLTLNYRFEVKTRGRSHAPAGEEEQQEEARPKKKKRATEPTEPGPSEPPPAAESVD